MAERKIIDVPAIPPPSKEELQQQYGAAGRRRSQAIRNGPQMTRAEMLEVLANSDAPIHRYPPGAHYGWVPSWLR